MRTGINLILSFSDTTHGCGLFLRAFSEEEAPRRARYTLFEELPIRGKGKTRLLLHFQDDASARSDPGSAR
jgi:hypothetical protein